MQFQKETIMGQVLFQVNEDETNQYYIEQIEDLLEDIEEKVYMDEEVSAWNRNGLVITDRELMDQDHLDTAWIFIETPEVSAYSWLVKQLNQIYNPETSNSYRLNTTIGYMLKIYDEKYDDLSDVMKMVTIVSTVYLHPDHMGYDRFTVHPISLPPFGDDF
jgi:Mg2+ and Co2+ transporter CorA